MDNTRCTKSQGTWCDTSSMHASKCSVTSYMCVCDMRIYHMYVQDVYIQCIYIYVYVYIYICICLYIYIYIYMYILYMYIVYIHI